MQGLTQCPLHLIAVQDQMVSRPGPAAPPRRLHLVFAVWITPEQRGELALVEQDDLSPGAIVKTLDDYDFSFQPDLDPRKIKDLATLAFVQAKANVALLGPPGVGKTHRLAPPRHPRHRRAPVHHHAATRPKSGCAGLTLYKVIRELQRLLATWTGACLTCHQPVKPIHRNKRHRT